MKNFADIVFTDDVKLIQAKMGARKGYSRMEQRDGPRRLSEQEKVFISQSEVFYQATVSANGWPYIQHRGGPRGFLRVLSNNQIAYADFSGNERLSLIIMDYSSQARLKIWGRAKIVDKSDDP